MQLLHHKAAVEDIDSSVDSLDWWKRHEQKLPNWCSALVQPTSAAAERVFSLLQNSFSQRQSTSLEDYIEAGGSRGGNFWHQAGFLHSPLTPYTSYAVIKRHVIIFTIAVLLIIHRRACRYATSSPMATSSLSTPPTGIASARAGDNSRKRKHCRWLRNHWS